MGAEDLGVRVTEPLQQQRRALDVTEEERDDTPRKGARGGARRAVDRHCPTLGAGGRAHQGTSPPGGWAPGFPGDVVFLVLPLGCGTWEVPETHGKSGAESSPHDSCCWPTPTSRNAPATSPSWCGVLSTRPTWSSMPATGWRSRFSTGSSSGPGGSSLS